jgi:hypothetical protein
VVVVVRARLEGPQIHQTISLERVVLAYLLLSAGLLFFMQAAAVALPAMLLMPVATAGMAVVVQAAVQAAAVALVALVVAQTLVAAVAVQHTIGLLERVGLEKLSFDTQTASVRPHLQRVLLRSRLRVVFVFIRGMAVVVSQSREKYGALR